MSILLFFAILLVLVIVHEFGHFYSAKKFGIRVDEFGFGFPPKLFGIKKGETEYTLNALPFGGFVKIFGENPDDESLSGPDSARSFVNHPRWQQAIVLFAGVFANFLLAWFLFSLGLMSGLPTSVNGDLGKYVQDANLVVISVAPGSSAETAGLLPGDQILKVTAQKDVLEDPTPETLKSFVLLHGKEKLTLESVRNGEPAILEITPKSEGGEAKIGISMDMIGTAKLGLFPAIWKGMTLTVDITKATAVGLFSFIWQAIKGEGSLGEVTGPVGLVGLVGDVYKFGFTYLMSFAALISVNLAVLNLLPFPALDGGRLFFLLIEKIKGSRISPRVANTANMLGFAILIIFMLVVTFHDVAKLL